MFISLVQVVKSMALRIAHDEQEQAERQWEEDCQREHGRVLTGKHRHYCAEWDGLPIDETCPEYDACLCFEGDAEWPLTEE